jgi:hypothetical protein
LLYDRIIHQGTLSEPNGVPDPQFALPPTINWMHALALIVRSGGVSFTSASQFYVSTQRRTLSAQENTIFEQLLFALHQLSALEALRLVPRQADVARVGIVAWYYGVYAAASAMVAAQDGSIQDGHAGTANSWDRHFAARDLLMQLFALRVSTLVESAAKPQIATLRRSSFDLKSPALTSDDALGALCSYLSGTAGWYRWKTTEELRTSKEFKALGVSCVDDPVEARAIWYVRRGRVRSCVRPTLRGLMTAWP